MPDEKVTRDRAEEWFALLTDAREPAPHDDRPIRLPVLSGSMRPEIPVGAVLGIRRHRRLQTRDGDLIVFRSAQTLVVHRRLLALKVGSLATLYQKGDAMATGSWIRPAAVVGVAVEVELPDGSRRDLTTRDSRRRALRLARRSLAADLKQRFRNLIGRG